MKITLKQLRIFCSIYRLGSTTLASEELALSQSAVSNALNTLEHSLNHPLFERDGKNWYAMRQQKNSIRKRAQF